MATWLTVTLTIAAAAVGGGLTLLATLLSGRREDQRREADRRDRLREQGAEVVGPLRELIQEIEPLGLGLFARAEILDGLRETRERLRDLRERLAVYAAAHPSPKVGEIAYKLGPAASVSLAGTFFFVESVLKRAGGDKDAMDHAVAVHNTAVGLADELLARIRDEPPGSTPSPGTCKPALEAG